MKHFYILLCLTMISVFSLNAQTVINEDFESATPELTTFTSSEQVFDITSTTPNNSFKITQATGSGWNGSAVDDKFIDNSTSIVTGQNPSFSIKTNDGNPFNLKSFWFFFSPNSGTSANGELSIIGKLNGATVFTAVGDATFVENLPISNGFFKKADLTSLGGTDNSNVNIDEFVISTSNNVYYIELDALEWKQLNLITLDIQDFTLIRSKVLLYPNPSIDYIQLSGLGKTEKYAIFNFSGTKILNSSISNGEKIDIQSLTNGIYFLKFKNGNTIKFMKL